MEPPVSTPPTQETGHPSAPSDPSVLSRGWNQAKQWWAQGLEWWNRPRPATGMTLAAYWVLIVLVLVAAGIVAGRLGGLAASECHAMNSLYGKLNGQMQSVDDTLPEFQHPWNQYYIKSAYNACSGGQYRNDFVDLCSLKAVLKQGVRGLDFQLFSIQDQPVVATSTNPSPLLKETFNYVPFADVLETLMQSAFSTSTAPNAADPVIVHLRFQSHHLPMYQTLAKQLQKVQARLLPKEYDGEFQGQNMGNVPLSQLLGKIVLVVDRSNPTFLECPEFYSFVNLTSHSVFCRALRYYDIQFSPDQQELTAYNKQNMTVALPDEGANPSNPNGVVLRETGCQFLAMRYSQTDSFLEESEAFFNAQHTAFVLKPEPLRFVPETAPMPDPQTPAVSFAPRTVASDFYQFSV
jgi:hypothetical protein